VRAIVTGSRGQDGTLLCRQLRDEGTEVIEVTRRGVGHEEPVDLTSREAVDALFTRFRPDEVYHLAASHHSAEQKVDIGLEEEMIATNFRAAETMATVIARKHRKTRLLLAGTSRTYRAAPGEELIVDESTPMNPVNFYGRTKAWSRDLLTYFRETHGIFGVTAILFNHESPLRPARFVTRKVTLAAAQAKRGQLSRLNMMDVGSRTDWSSAPDVVNGMRLAIRATDPADYVFASGCAHSVSELLDVAFSAVGLDWKKFVHSQMAAGASGGTLIGNPARARQHLGWSPRMDFESMIREMVKHDFEAGGS
jgi:GDPmannose 4,6-dehydratase